MIRTGQWIVKSEDVMPAIGFRDPPHCKWFILKDASLGHPSLGSLPLPRFSRPKRSLNHRHVLDRIGQRNRNFEVFANGAGKEVPLNRVLITCGEGLGADGLA